MQLNKILSTLSATGLLFVAAPASADPLALAYMPSDVNLSCDVSESGFSDSWARLELNGAPTGLGPIYDVDNGLVYVFPPDGPAFNAAASNCDAFEWASQMFLWLTSTVTVNRLGGGHDPALPSDPKPTSAATNYVLSSEFMYRFDSGALQTQSNGQTLVRQSKVDEDADGNPVDGVEQAGSNGVLFTQGDTSVSTGSSLVYYDVYTSRPYGYVRAANLASAAGELPFTEFPANAEAVCGAIEYGLKNGFLKPKDIPLNTAIYGLLCKGVVPSGSLLGGDGPRPTVSEVESAIDYLSMALEVKASWVLASSVANPDHYIVQNSTVPVFEADGTTGALKQVGTQTVDLAMIGIHVVGSVNGHPEMIWATFEHYDNAPNVDYSYNDTTGATQTFSDMTTLASDGWLISDGTPTNANKEFASLVDGKITPSGSGAVTTPTNAVRVSPWGSDPTAASAATNTDVISSNVSVINALSGFYLGADGSEAAKQMLSQTDPRMNYILTGASWGKMGAFPERDVLTNVAGTPVMANTTMETFDQKSFAEYNGCFSCHGTSEPVGGFSVSHLFGDVSEVSKNSD
ncbi:hypothetical protein [Pseudosulfitobacter sp. SM2401]|uniref:hypothetical protein n=1 Tax=Pseudosulfitobacter sp. SM2401 TaxID=3350098 RepID=UPI0036F449F1